MFGSCCVRVDAIPGVGTYQLTQREGSGQALLPIDDVKQIVLIGRGMADHVRYIAGHGQDAGIKGGPGGTQRRGQRLAQRVGPWLRRLVQKGRPIRRTELPEDPAGRCHRHRVETGTTSIGWHDCQHRNGLMGRHRRQHRSGNGWCQLVK